MGTLGVPEMIIIFLLALVLFGPNKLPEIGRTIGKAITEFRKASSELKETFTTEYRNLERETESLKQATNDYQYDSSYNYDYSSYQSQTTEESNGDSADSTASNPSSESASAPQGAELPSAEPPEGSIAHGSIEEPVLAEAAEPGTAGEPQPQEASTSTSAEHKA